jgi:hypothetical protein
VRLPRLDDESLGEVLGAPLAVLLLSLESCPHCRAWSEELERHLATDAWPEVRFGKAVLDAPGLERFKASSPWLEELAGVPFNVIYQDGEPRDGFAGAGLERLERRLARLLSSP